MGSVLIEGWLAGQESTPMLDEASVVLLRKHVHDQGSTLGFSEAGLGSIVNVASELAHNQLAHARGGRLAVRSIERAGVRGLEVIAADRGSGIAKPTEALRGRPDRAPPSGSSLGIGLSAALELADEVDFDVRIGEGSCVWARKFAGPVPRRRRVGIYGRPYPGEDESGDDGAFVRLDDDLVVSIVDGLGHGTPAREASALAVATVRRESREDIDRIVQSCHDDIRDTRGAVMALARIGEIDSTMRAAVVGDTIMLVEGPTTHRRIVGRAFVLGSSGARPKVAVEEAPLELRDVVLLCTDGISPRADFRADAALLREHPIVIAHQIVERFARSNDDALVVVVA
jgi:anti-sigma regulatory factor (Ser/Thr protein kinase)